jgi:5'-nucleotidase
MLKKPRILITNDDGIHAPGIHHLWEALAHVADLFIVAPATEQSGVGLGITVRNPLHIETVAWAKNTPAWKVSGTPADCVRMAMSVLGQKPDLIVSGINKGSNAGRTALYSGTVGGVIDGVLRGIPGIAFSCVEFHQPNYARTQKFIWPIVRYQLEHPLPAGSFLNVNFPDHLDEIKGVKLARQGSGYWIEDPKQGIHPEGNPYYWQGGKWHHCDEHTDSDVHLINEGYAAAVPIQVSELTNHAILSERKTAFEDYLLKS